LPSATFGAAIEFISKFKKLHEKPFQNVEKLENIKRGVL
jgi:hypothetical protein